MTEQEKLYYELGFQKGRISGVWDFAIHRDGRMLVGCLERDYRDVTRPNLDKIQAILQKMNKTECQAMDCPGCPDC